MRGENQTEQMIRLTGENRIGLCAGHWQRTDNFSDPSEIVTLICIERRKHLVCSDRHRCEKENAVGLALCAEEHHPVVEAVSTLFG